MLGNNQANIKAVITAEDRASRTLSKFGGGLAKTAKRAGIAVGAAGAAAVAFGVSAVKSFQESEDAVTQLNAVLKSTKGVAGVTAKAAQDLASSLQLVTKFSDEQILSGQNLLLTFTKIGKDIFPQATETMLDMSQALGQDVKASAIQMGKALQDPILGVTALRRVGVNFNNDAKETIKRLVETGQAAKAQAFILKELQVEFGGAARAAGTTFSGRLAILRNQFDEVKEAVGRVIVNALYPLMQRLAQFVNWLQQNGPRIRAFFAQIRGYAVSAVNALKNAWNSLRGQVLAVWNTLKNQLGPQLLELARNVRPVARAVGGALVVALKVGLFFMNAFAKALSVVLSIVNAVINAIEKLAGWIGKVASFVSAPFKALGGLISKIPGFASGTSFAPGGMAVVGEQGPELVNLPRGSQVIPNHELGGMGGVNITIQAGAYMGSRLEARKFALLIMDAYKELASSRNMTATQMLGR